MGPSGQAFSCIEDIVSTERVAFASFPHSGKLRRPRSDGDAGRGDAAARNPRGHSLGQRAGVRGQGTAEVARESRDRNAPFRARQSPWENGYCETFNGKLRDECLNGEIFFRCGRRRSCLRSGAKSTTPGARTRCWLPATSANGVRSRRGKWLWKRRAETSGLGKRCAFPLSHSPGDGRLSSPTAEMLTRPDWLGDQHSLSSPGTKSRSGQ